MSGNHVYHKGTVKKGMLEMHGEFKGRCWGKWTRKGHGISVPWHEGWAGEKGSVSTKERHLGLGCSLVVEHLPSMCKALGTIPNTAERERERERERRRDRVSRMLHCSNTIGHAGINTYSAE
jgi:hypothetical protein